MSSKLRVLVSDTFDPWFNLATEDWIFRELSPDTHVLFLWRNRDTVVIGRYQNPWIECNLEQMESDNVLLARRQSGGGAVFHDLGNTNFTFLSSKKNYDKGTNNSIICKALKEFGIDATPSGRNDILVDGQKISGSAFKETKDRAFHHGTLLINANLSRLAQYLNPHPKKLMAKGIQSVKARVTNLTNFNSEITHQNLSEVIIKQFLLHHGAEAPVEFLNHNDLKLIPTLANYYEKLKDWNWRFGETPSFTHRLEEKFDWGLIDIHLKTDKGVIQEAIIFSDSLHPEMIEYLMKNLQGKAYSEEGLKTAIRETQKELPMIEDYLEELLTWGAGQIK